MRTGGRCDAIQSDRSRKTLNRQSQMMLQEGGVKIWRPRQVSDGGVRKGPVTESVGRSTSDPANETMCPSSSELQWRDSRSLLRRLCTRGEFAGVNDLTKTDWLFYSTGYRRGRILLHSKERRHPSSSKCNTVVQGTVTVGCKATVLIYLSSSRKYDCR